MSFLLDDVKGYMRQFSPPRAVGYSLARLVTRVFDGSAGFTYSQFGEDRVLPLFMPRKRSGFYVDVGANHPTTHSNTFWLYKQGWHGVVVEPNTTLLDLHRRVRPRDIQVQALVSDTNTVVEFVEFRDHTKSTMSENDVKKWDPATIVRRHSMTPRSLTSILDESRSPQDIDLLCVDVEGVDICVLRSLDWTKYRPRIVVAEMSDFRPGDLHPTLSFLQSQGFSLKAFDGFNGYLQK
jgi:FkbM family methyltransferase